MSRRAQPLRQHQARLILAQAVAEAAVTWLHDDETTNASQKALIAAIRRYEKARSA